MRMRAVFLVLTLTSTAIGQETKSRDPEELKKLPIAAGDGEIAKLLRQWWDEGTAAGNVGDWYDNRDGEHSPLDLKPWPQLQKAHYTNEMLKAKVNWAGQRRVVPAVVFGNSSTSAPATQTGSNPRTFYSIPAGLATLAEQYGKNNLYIYPEHRDHDPGRNGLGPGGAEGYGDLYPTNTPYVIISQGSSGSDQPFMRAMPYLLAAFRPEVKAKLIETGALMPTIQAIFRASNKHLKEGDYLTGKAHPTVFDGAWVDPLRMVRMAHELTLETLPPVVRLKVIEEDTPKAGVDFFDTISTERLGDTPQVIARIFRGKDRWRRMIVSAEETRNLSGKPLTFEWKLLRGDPDRVTITPKNEAKSIVEIRVAHLERRPISPGSSIESPRVDVGVFAKTGDSPWSAPGFITWFGLDGEIRTYDDKGRIAEIGYGAGETRVSVKDWRKLLASSKEIGELTEAQTAAIAKIDAERTAFLAGKPDEKTTREFDAKEHKKLTEVLAGTIGPRLDKLLATPAPEAADETQETNRKKLDEILRNLGADAVIPGKDRPAAKGPTAYDRNFKSYQQAEKWRQALADSLIVHRIANVVDPRISFPRTWRDVYLYDRAGECVGWVRFVGKDPISFTADGHLIVERDDLGRCVKAKKVAYRVDALKAPPNQFAFHWVDTGEEVEYVYAGPDDRRGKVK